MHATETVTSMTLLRIYRVAIAWLLFSTTCQAQPTSSKIEYSFESPDLPRILDFTGYYPEPLGETLLSSAAGRLTGSSGISGHVTAGRAGIHLTLSKSLAYWADSSWFNGTAVRIRCQTRLRYDPSGRVLTGIERCQTKLVRVTLFSQETLSNESTKTPIQVPAPVTMSGDWWLQMEVVTENNRLSGAATLTLSSGQTIELRLSGSRSTGRSESRILLTGEGIYKGAVLRLAMTDHNLALNSIRGKVEGQFIRWP